MKKEYKIIKINDLKPYANNPRKNDNAVEAVAESIKQCGYIAPIITDENLEILAGHTRLKALQMLGKDKAEILIISGLSEEQKKKFRLLDNKTGELAGWDFIRLDLELENLDFNGFDFGFDEIKCDINGFGTDFELPDGEKNVFETCTFTLHREQKELVEYAISLVNVESVETFGNTNQKGNALYAVVKEWAEQKKLT